MKLMNSAELASLNNELLAEMLELNHSNILNRWKKNSNVKIVFNLKQIDSDVFMRHFGARVLDYFIDVLSGTQPKDQCPVISAMLIFFAKRNLILYEIYNICSGMRNTILNTLLQKKVKNEELFTILIELFDTNFSGVIREYIYNMDNKNQNINKISKHTSPSGTLQATTFKEHREDVVKLSDKHSAVMHAKDAKECFLKEHDDDFENIMISKDDADNLLKHFQEIPEKLMLAFVKNNPNEIETAADMFLQISSILLRYSSYFDALAASFIELEMALRDNQEEFMKVLLSKNDSIMSIFDAVCIDMESYIRRFCFENIIMKNSHQIHEPTRLSIIQIISTFSPNNIEEGEIEFF